MTEFSHIPVMLDECVDALNIKKDGVYIDGTLGGAGHSSHIAPMWSWSNVKYGR